MYLSDVQEIVKYCGELIQGRVNDRYNVSNMNLLATVPIRRKESMFIGVCSYKCTCSIIYKLWLWANIKSWSYSGLEWMSLYKEASERWPSVCCFELSSYKHFDCLEVCRVSYVALSYMFSLFYMHEQIRFWNLTLMGKELYFTL